MLTEGPAILQYLADLRPEANLAPPNGTFERVRLQEWLNFVSTEIHGGLGWLFNSQFPDDVKALIKEKLFKRFCRVGSDVGEAGLFDGWRIQYC